MTIKKSLARQTLERLMGERLTFGKMIESIRKSDDISQVALAEKMKISKAHLCDIEKGRRHVTLSRAIMFAKVLGYSEKQFVAKAIEDQVYEAGLSFKVTLSAA